MIHVIRKFAAPIPVICTMLVAMPILAQANPKAEVMLFGVFHFANPGLDVVNVDQMNVMTPENQEYLSELASRIAEFKPTVILLEFNPEKTPAMQREYQQYLEGKLELGSNEIYQLGFRIGKLACAEAIHSFDERDVAWRAEPLFAYLAQDDPKTKARMDALIAEVTKQHEEAHASLSLGELILQSNDPQQDELNQYFYLATN